eukprot:Phypoly_transcript_10986.p1 GENE.Phypoly_transcript_10986~~Phypoly_transcript_10986.p1  ORF type:complete len:351 (+),score=42.65 Phypoly_transcript_10986:176-1228(+)
MDLVERQIETVRNFPDALFGPLELHKRTPQGARYDFSFRYCGKQMTWNILYDLANLSFAPDFSILSEPETLFVPLAQFKSLQHYDARDPKALLHIIYELLQFFKDYQKTLVKDYANERVQFQYSVIESNQDTLFLFDRGESEVRFMIPLGIDLQAELGEEGADNKTALVPYVLLNFKDSVNDPKQNTEVRLFTPPLVDKLLSKMALPTWTESTVTMDYLEQTKNSVSAYLNSMKARKRFIQACIVAFGSPLEYDSIYFSRVSFFFQEIEAVAYFSLPDAFPEKQPSIMLLSVMCLKGNPLKPIQAVFETYPYSPRWGPNELTQRIRTFLLAQKFKDYCADEVAKEEKGRS